MINPIYISRKELDRFLGENKINTGGALNEHKITIKDIDDGDVGYKLIIPFWWQNKEVVDSILKLIIKIRERFTNTVYVRNDEIIVDIFISLCDPD